MILVKKVDNLGEKIDDLGKKMESAKEYLGTKIDKVGEKIDALRVDLREYYDQRLKRIEEDIEKIKLKLGMTWGILLINNLINNLFC